MHDMPGIGNDIYSRTISAFPLSIGTSLAFESLFEPKLDPYDPTRPIPNNININNYEQIYINVSTMFRNIVGAINKNAFENTTAEQFKDVLEFEIDVINNLLANEGKGICIPVYYNTNHDKLEKRLVIKSVKFRQHKTESQQHYKKIHDETIKLLLKFSDTYVNTDEEIVPKNKSKSLIVTHIPYDLLSYRNFQTLDLLESHTGKLKHKFQWNSKYANLGTNDLSMLPFTRKLLLIFGDKILIHPGDFKLRRLILDTALSRQWTPMTTDAKIIQDLDITIKEPYVLQYLHNL
jgi:hypothetical protein